MVGKWCFVVVDVVMYFMRFGMFILLGVVCRLEILFWFRIVVVRRKMLVIVFFGLSICLRGI